MSQNNICEDKDQWDAEYKARKIKEIRQTQTLNWQNSIVEIILSNIIHIEKYNTRAKKYFADFIQSPSDETYDRLYQILPKDVQDKLNDLPPRKKILLDDIDSYCYP
tara:strand:- start:883 stop:1203 length:321 start_codon:yes stop_codon:yes gene_type:complete